MGSTSDLPVMEKAAQLLNDLHVPFEMNALSAHRTPEAVEEFAKNARQRGIKVIIAAAGMAAALPGVIAANTTLPVIGVPIKGCLLQRGTEEKNRQGKRGSERSEVRIQNKLKSAVSG